MHINYILTKNNTYNVNNKFSQKKNATCGIPQNANVCFLSAPNAYYNSQLINLSFGFKFIEPVSKEERFKGCLFGGAIGDAFGGLIEWLSTEEIKQKYGNSGLRYIPKRNGVYRVTDDTQMTLFTCEGLMKSILKNSDITKEPDYDLIYSSYQNWYETQIMSAENSKKNTPLMRESSLFVRRGPGNTCMTALANGVAGSMENPINDSMGNGGVMRIAPIGLLYSDNPELAFLVAAKSTALTHGHPNAYLPAGYVAALIAQLANGNQLDYSIEYANNLLKQYPDHESTLECINKAIKFSKTDIDTATAIESIGYGGRGDEALGISLYSVLKSPNNIKKALTIAVNHSGDSDSTGAITGNILGAYLGISKLPNNWTEKVEHANLLDIFSFGLNAAQNTYSRSNKGDSISKRSEEDVFVSV